MLAQAGFAMPIEDATIGGSISGSAPGAYGDALITQTAVAVPATSCPVTLASLQSMLSCSIETLVQPS